MVQEMSFYSLIKANRGILEKVVIKSQKLIKSKKTYNRFVVLYTDTLNGLWNESDTDRIR